MRLKLMALQIALTLVMACSLFEDEVEWRRMPVSVDSIAVPDTVVLGQPILFEMTCTVPDPCWQFSDLGMNDHNYDVWVKVHAKRNPEWFCYEWPSSISATGTYRPDWDGIYKFHFWQSDSSSLDTVVVVRSLHPKTQTPAKGRM